MSDDTSMLSIRLPNDLRDEIDRVARQQHRSRSFVVKEAINAYVEEQRAYYAAIDEALAEVDQGKVIDGGSVASWLQSWGSQAESATPESEPSDRDG
jgi:predicted transcriptional regulator